VIIASLILAAGTPVSSDTAILAQLSAGKMLCSNPDAATKTCSAIASYAAGKNGAFVETSEVLLPVGQPLTLQLSVAAQVKGSTICAVMNEADLQKGVVRINGSPLPLEQNVAVLSKLIEKLKPMAGREVCEELRVEDGRLMKYGRAERVDINLPGKPVRWINDADGYKVGTR
jgi:hypothetical protein